MLGKKEQETCRAQQNPYQRKESFDWGEMEWLVEDSADANVLEKETLTAVGMSVVRMRVWKGKTGQAHRHDTCAEFVVVIEGCVYIHLADKAYHLKAGDSLFIPKGEPHQILADKEHDALCYVSYSSGRRDYKTTALFQ